MADIRDSACPVSCSRHAHHTLQSERLLAAQDVKALEKKWRRKVKEARAEKESLRSELAGRLALLADRMTQLASKEARHETRQGEVSNLYAHSTFSRSEFRHSDLCQISGKRDASQLVASLGWLAVLHTQVLTAFRLL